MTANNEKFAIVLEAQPRTAPGYARLKRLLKYALRGLGLRCVEIRKVTDIGSRILSPDSVTSEPETVSREAENRTA